MKTKVILSTLIVLPLAALFAADEPAPKAKQDPAQVFKMFDRDGDGGISLAEYKKGMAGQLDPARVEEVFKKKDADGDGKLTLPELMFVPPKEAAPAAAAKKPKKE